MNIISRTCEFCNRGPNKIHSRSNSNISTIMHQKLNLQHKKISGVRMRICTSCMKTIKKTETSKQKATA